MIVVGLAWETKNALPLRNTARVLFRELGGVWFWIVMMTEGAGNVFGAAALVNDCRSV